MFEWVSELLDNPVNVEMIDIGAVFNELRNWFSALRM